MAKIYHTIVLKASNTVHNATIYFPDDDGYTPAHVEGFKLYLRDKLGKPTFNNNKEMYPVKDRATLERMNREWKGTIPIFHPVEEVGKLTTAYLHLHFKGQNVEAMEEFICVQD